MSITGRQTEGGASALLGFHCVYLPQMLPGLVDFLDRAIRSSSSFLAASAEYSTRLVFLRSGSACSSRCDSKLSHRLNILSQ